MILRRGSKFDKATWMWRHVDYYSKAILYYSRVDPLTRRQKLTILNSVLRFILFCGYEILEHVYVYYMKYSVSFW